MVEPLTDDNLMKIQRRMQRFISDRVATEVAEVHLKRVFIGFERYFAFVALRQLWNPEGWSVFWANKKNFSKKYLFTNYKQIHLILSTNSGRIPSLLKKFTFKNYE